MAKKAVAKKTPAPRVRVFNFDSVCMTSDNQLAKATVAIKYASDIKQDVWLNERLKPGLTVKVDDYVAETDLYDVTSDRNPPKKLCKDLLVEAKKRAAGPEESILLSPATGRMHALKIEDVSIIIKRER